MASSGSDHHGSELTRAGQDFALSGLSVPETKSSHAQPILDDSKHSIPGIEHLVDESVTYRIARELWPRIQAASNADDQRQCREHYQRLAKTIKIDETRLERIKKVIDHMRHGNEETTRHQHHGSQEQGHLGKLCSESGIVGEIAFFCTAIERLLACRRQIYMKMLDVKGKPLDQAGRDRQKNALDSDAVMLAALLHLGTACWAQIAKEKRNLCKPFLDHQSPTALKFLAQTEKEWTTDLDSMRHFENLLKEFLLPAVVGLTEVVDAPSLTNILTHMLHEDNDVRIRKIAHVFLRVKPDHVSVADSSGASKSVK